MVTSFTTAQHLLSWRQMQGPAGMTEEMHKEPDFASYGAQPLGWLLPLLVHAVVGQSRRGLDKR